MGLQLGYIGFGVAFDDSLNWGTYAFSGQGVQVGAEVGAGFSVQGSDAQYISDLSGPFRNGGFHAGDVVDGSIDYFSGASPNGPVHGFGVTVGAAVGASLSVGKTDTVVCTTAACYGSASK